MATSAEALSLLDQLSRELDRRQDEQTRAEAYYDGEHNLLFASPQFQQYFGGLFTYFADNWCQVVVDSVAERLTVRGIRLSTGTDAIADAESRRVWQENELDADSGLAFVDTLTAGRTHVLVWGNLDDEDTPEVTFEAPCETIVGYEPGSRRRRRAALKRWRDDDNEYATLYLPDEVWKFVKPAFRVPVVNGRTESGLAVAGTVSMAGEGWKLREVPGEPNPMRNPMGVVPMVELPNRSRLAKDPVSEIRNVIPLQDAVNLLWSHLLTASDFAAFPQRVILGTDVPKKPIVDAVGEVVGYEPVDLAKYAVDRVVWLEDPNAKIGEWSAADLANYTNVIEVAVGHIAAQTRTPQHYLIGKMANMSADALKAAETGLVSRVRERQVYLGEAIREMWRLVALAQNDEARAKAIKTGTVLWADPESRSDAELVDSLVKLKGIGVPDEALWERYGADVDEIERWSRMRDQAASRILAGDLAALVGPKPDPEAEDGQGQGDGQNPGGPPPPGDTQGG
ncbi:phage portal protein [Microbispora sp. SCL1-1]|uniref:phage portal protein n=1 Tax=unclassified Microbispora TaxID=2614687 RepID=UPI0011590284|nr:MULTISPECIES: phage portal protein [unclassified Microbispora]NJP27096.1 phage portal protein [Microbispora sp. CL1-1]TQS11441.1 phage portal protein [Microbispora sp. SCL1-1]